MFSQPEFVRADQTVAIAGRQPVKAIQHTEGRGEN